MRRRTDKASTALYGGLLSIASIIAAINIGSNFQVEVLALFFAFLSMLSATISVQSIRTEFHPEEGLSALLLRLEIRKQLIDAGFYLPGYTENTVCLPQIMIALSDNGLYGKVMIENKLKFRGNLETDVSMIFPHYVVDTYYLTDDGSYFVYEIYRSDCNYQLLFQNLDEFRAYLKGMPDYTLFIDGRLQYKLMHTLISGQTGSGKSYGTYCLVYQLREMSADLFIADPKASGLARLGSIFNPKQTANDFDSICNLLRDFEQLLSARNHIVSEGLGNRIDGDYTTLSLRPAIFVLDEFGAFISQLQGRDKKLKDEINGILERTIYTGRSSGCFLFIIMQQASAQILPTRIRDNIPAKILLARGLETETATVCFGQSDAQMIPKRNYMPGEAYYKVAGLNSTPKRCTFPELGFTPDEYVSAETPLPGGAAEWCLCNYHHRTNFE